MTICVQENANVGDVYVDDVAVDEAGAGAYLFAHFFAQTQRCPHQLLINGRINRRSMDESYAECRVEDKPVDCMPNVTRVSLEDNPFYSMSPCGTFHMGSAISPVC